jgi:hypothetical protein
MLFALQTDWQYQMKDTPNGRQFILMSALTPYECQTVFDSWNYVFDYRDVTTSILQVHVGLRLRVNSSWLTIKAELGDSTQGTITKGIDYM